MLNSGTEGVFVGSMDGVSVAEGNCDELGVITGVSKLDAVGDGVEVAKGETVCKGCEALRTIESLKFAINPALSNTWQYTVLSPFPLVNCQFAVSSYGCQGTWSHMASLLNLIWLTPENKSVASTVRLTAVSEVDVSPLFIWIEPWGGVFCS